MTATLDDAIARLIGRHNLLYDEAVAKATAEWDAAQSRADRITKSFAITSLHPEAKNIEEQAKQMHAIADKQALLMRRSIFRVVARARQAIDMAQLERAIEAGNIYSILGAMPPLRSGEIEKAALDITQDEFGRYLYLAYLDTVNEFGTSQLSFDLINPYAVQYAASRSDFMFNALSQQQMAQIRDVLTRAVNAEYDPHTAAVLMRDMIGLGTQGSTAVANYRLALVDRMESGATLGEAARAAGEVRALANVGLNGADSIDALTERYADRWVAYRADMIARTETMRAANMGNLQSWQVAAQQGLIDPNASSLVWYTAEDDTVCDECDALDQAVVGFSSGDLFDGVETPPLHPNCRCIITLDAELPQEEVPPPIVDDTEPGFADEMMDTMGNLLPQLTPDELRDAIEQPFGDKRPFARDLWSAMRNDDDPASILDAIHAAASDYGDLGQIRGMVPTGTPVRQQAVERISTMAQQLSDQTLAARGFPDQIEVWTYGARADSINTVDLVPKDGMERFVIDRSDVLTDVQGLFGGDSTVLQVDGAVLRGAGDISPVIEPVMPTPTIALEDVVGPLGQIPVDQDQAIFFRDIEALLNDVGPREDWFDLTSQGVRYDMLPTKTNLDALNDIKSVGARIDQEVRRIAGVDNQFVTTTGKMGVDSERYQELIKPIMADYREASTRIAAEQEDVRRELTRAYELLHPDADRYEVTRAIGQMRDLWRSNPMHTDELPQIDPTMRMLLDRWFQYDRDYTGAYDSMQAALKPLREEAMRADNDYATAMRQVLAELKPMGIGDENEALAFVRANITTDEDFVGRMATALQNYPREWIDKVVDQPVKFNVQKLTGDRSGRAFYRSYDNAVYLNAKLADDSRGAWSTAVHEFGHAVENAINEIRQAEWSYYWQRTTPLAKGTGELADARRTVRLGRGYRPDEVYRKGKSKDFAWFNKYMGKAYGEPPTWRNSYELLTMGMEGVTGGDSLGFIGEDPDMVAFILGMLAAG